MVLLLDIGNTHTHAGLGGRGPVRGGFSFPTASWMGSAPGNPLLKWLKGRTPDGVAVCSVVPKATRRTLRWVRGQGWEPLFELTAATVNGIGVSYPDPNSIGADRLANAVAARHHYGAPSLVVDFGTAVTFDVVNRSGNYVGGVIAPGLAAMTEYLHEKTALLPRIQIREIHKSIGKNTNEAMLIGAVRGYRGLIRELIKGIRLELNTRRLPVVATGGYASLMARGLPEITRADSALTLEGLRLAWLNR